MADVKSLFAKKKGKKKSNTLNTNVIPTSNQHIDAEALSVKTVVADDDGWADKTEKKKVVVSSGKSLGDLQEMKSSSAEKVELNDNSQDMEPRKPSSKSGWGANSEETEDAEKKDAETVEKLEPPIVEEKFKPFLARRPVMGAPKPNTESTMEFPTLDTAVAETSKVVPASSATATSSSNNRSPNSYTESSALSSSSSSTSRPKLALKPRTAPLPDSPSTENMKQSEPSNVVEPTLEKTHSDVQRPTEPSWRGQSALQGAGNAPDSNRDAPTWRGQSTVPQGGGNSPDRDKDPPSWRGQPVVPQGGGNSADRNPPSWRGQSSVPQGGGQSDRDRDPPSWRGQSSVPQGGGQSDRDRDPPSWRGQSATLPPPDTGGIKFGGSGTRPKLALKKRTVDIEATPPVP